MVNICSLWAEVEIQCRDSPRQVARDLATSSEIVFYDKDFFDKNSCNFSHEENLREFFFFLFIPTTKDEGKAN